MKRTYLRTLLLILAGAGLAAVASAQPINQLLNPGFESPAIGKLTNFSLAYPWQDDGTNYVNTGIEETGAHSGSYRAFEMSTDNGAYQITSYQMNAGDLISLTWWAMGTYNGSSTTFTGTGASDPLQTVGLISATSTGAAFSATAGLAVTNSGLPGTQAGWVQYSLTYTAAPADAGNYIGCYFNTEQVGTNTPNTFAAYDDFYLAVLPAGSPPSIVTEPTSQTAYKGNNVTFSVSAVGATSYQWEVGAVGSGVYSNLSNGGQFSGVNTPTLTITNVTAANNGDYVVVVSNGNGSVTSTPPATLTVATIIYQETFNVPTTPDQSITNVGWINDIQGAGNRIFTDNGGVTFPQCAVYSYVGNATNEAFYATTATANGSISNQEAFTGVNLATVTNLSFAVDLNSPYNGTLTHSFIAVQMNFGSWYMSTSELLPQPSTTTFITDTLTFSPSASAWAQLTLSGTGSLNTPYPILGPPATNSLVGYITGIGIVCEHTGGSTVQFRNYTVLGATPPSTLPVINSPPFSQTNYTGTTATFTVTATTNGSTAGLTYQWKDGTVGSGVYANLSNGGQFSGVTTPTLTIANVSSAANHKDYVVVVTDGAGSVTSVPPATLTIVDSAPFITANASVYPNAATGFSATSANVTAGNNNILNLTAAFAGTLPITYQWQFSANSNGTGAVNIPNANAATLTLANPQTNSSGYYSLQAANSRPGSPVNSAWIPVTVQPATTAPIKWSAPVAINGKSATQILQGTPGAFFEAESFFGTSVVSVTNNGTVFVFDNTSASAGTTGGVGNKYGVYTGPATGDSNLDTVLGTDSENGGGALTTLNNLTVGQLYSVQVIALNDVAGVAREANFSDTNDIADVSPSFAMGDNVYVVGKFIATNTTEAFTENEADGHGYISAVIVRSNVPPSVAIQPSGSNLQISWDFGTLLQAPSLNGPWTTNGATPPYTIAPSGPQQYFRARYP